MKKKIMMLLALIATLFVPAIYGASSASSATSTGTALDTRVKSAVASAVLPEFGTKPLGLTLIIR